jgi:hypothetical protein
MTSRNLSLEKYAFLVFFIFFAVSSSLAESPNNRLGMNLLARSPETALSQIPEAARAGLGAVRIPLDWNRVEPRRGEFYWSDYDRMVAAAEQHHLEVVFVLGPTAEWASCAEVNEAAEVRICKMPRQWGDWENYVGAAVSHYRGKVKYWQIWEGFDFSHFRATQSGMSALISSTNKAAKAANPQAQLILPEPGGVDLGWIAWMKTTPAWKQFDILGLRPYRQQDGALQLPLAVLQSEVLAKNEKPVWIVGWAKGLAPEPSEASPGLTCLARVAFACGIEKAFGEAGQGLPPQGEVAPTLPPNREAVLKSLQPLPVSRVSMDMNAQPQENGLYNLNFRTWPGGRLVEMNSGVRRVLGTSMQKRALTSEADRLSDNPWFYFDVDDRWLFYTRGKIPIAITVECIGASGPDMSGFNIYYDAGAKQKFSPWQWIAPGAENVYTYRIVLPDAWLANKEGYDFRINAKGSKEDVFITKVTVEALPSAPGAAPAKPAGTLTNPAL